jgi:hypothetical protein
MELKKKGVQRRRELAYVLDGFFDGCEMRLTHDEDFVNTSYS